MGNQCTCPPDNCPALVRGALARDAAAQEAIYVKFGDLVRQIVRYRLGNDRSAEWDDACQEIFFRIYTKLPYWSGQGRFCDWLAVVTMKQAINIGIRLRRRRDEVPFEEFDRADLRDVDPAVRDCLNTTLATFPESWQQAVRLRIEGMKIDEIADQLAFSTRTIKAWFHAMYLRLQLCLDD